MPASDIEPLKVNLLPLSLPHPKAARVKLVASRLVQDSRRVVPGDIFVALGSSGSDASSYIQEALDSGAVAAIYDPEVSDNIDYPSANFPVFAYPDLKNNIGKITAEFYGNPDKKLNIIAVTGTNGKSSVTQLLAQSWQRLGIKNATIGTLGAGITNSKLKYTGLTTPPITEIFEYLYDYVQEDVKNVAVEVSSHALHQNRVSNLTSSVSVFTNLSRDHLDYHKDMQDYAAQKSKIFELAGMQTAVINIDNEFGKENHTKLENKLDVYGFSSQGEETARIAARDIRLDSTGTHFLLIADNYAAPINSQLMGRFNIDNLLAVASVLLSQGFDFDTVAQTLNSLTPVFGRMNRINAGEEMPLVIVDYAHTPDALEQSLGALKNHISGKIITIFGCTGDRDRGKRPEMARIAEQLSDHVIITDDDLHHENGDEIVAEIMTGIKNHKKVTVIRDRKQAIISAINSASAGDSVLIAGKGHESAMIIGDELVPFSDTETAIQALKDKSQALVEEQPSEN